MTPSERYVAIQGLVVSAALGLESARRARSEDLARRGRCGAPRRRRVFGGDTVLAGPLRVDYCSAPATTPHPLGYPWLVCGTHARVAGSTDTRALDHLYGPKVRSILLEVAGGRMSAEDGVVAAWARWAQDHPEDRPRIDFALTAEFTDVLPWKEA